MPLKRTRRSSAFLKMNKNSCFSKNIFELLLNLVWTSLWLYPHYTLPTKCDKVRNIIFTCLVYGYHVIETSHHNGTLYILSMPRVISTSQSPLIIIFLHAVCAHLWTRLQLSCYQLSIQSRWKCGRKSGKNGRKNGRSRRAGVDTKDIQRNRVKTERQRSRLYVLYSFSKRESVFKNVKCKCIYGRCECSSVGVEGRMFSRLSDRGEEPVDADEKSLATWTLSRPIKFTHHINCLQLFNLWWLIKQ